VLDTLAAVNNNDNDDYDYNNNNNNRVQNFQLGKQR
jgi:hypothetical protein